MLGFLLGRAYVYMAIVAGDGHSSTNLVAYDKESLTDQSEAQI